MNQVLSLVHAARASSDPAPSLYSDHMLAELLSLHEEMLAQMHRQRFSVIGTADFRTCIMKQHERAAAMLRAQLESSAPFSVGADAVAATHEAGSAAENSFALMFAKAFAA